ncbi:molybdate ABC transporter substrate-binding protein [Shewanella sp. D64]|uniref:molybdate ABC transporter substrate-binding protein n=1 Tax=unclassified Shewanella TaxID=196818 RepID=UPI0022BA63CE|nr:MULTISPECIES: molybdate ABC transporter substrate-binding protein [unclassified Shewanella]MEC4729037.1 molybdate ABC transporter substrate-binding protein [Shewanella sp. D64]MEC4739888.1 molybdate ABC transporter substrate-binding protein [Shewanella sp. E94]WBJ97145.1 molybdate ABC transporter substrate-binding protein [Shewanella sp. MTB7]
MKLKKYCSRLKHLATSMLLVTVSLPSFAEEKVIVFAAASLTNALTEIGQKFDQLHHSETVFSFASSSTLARQIAQGAPAQVFLSANQKWMDYLIDNDAVSRDSKVTLLKNSLVLIAPNLASPLDITISKDWDLNKNLANGRLAVGDPDHVPAGRYAKQALSNLNLWQQAEPLLARASSVRSALALVERGEAPLGIVYSTDAQLSKAVVLVDTFPENSHNPIEYPLALVNNQPTEGAKAFYQYLQTQDAKAIFSKYGFKIKP